MNIFQNPNARADRRYGTKQRDALDPESAELVRREISSWPQYQQTPLISLPGLARTLGLDAGARVLVFGTEGDTDPELYRQLVGLSAEEVLGRSTG